VLFFIRKIVDIFGIEFTHFNREVLVNVIVVVERERIEILQAFVARIIREDVLEDIVVTVKLKLFIDFTKRLFNWYLLSGSFNAACLSRKNLLWLLLDIELLFFLQGCDFESFKGIPEIEGMNIGILK